MRRHGDGQTQTRSAADVWVPTTHLPTAASHPFYRRLNELLREHGFDDLAEAQCASFYAETMGRPGLDQGQNDRHRRDDTRGQRGVAQHRLGELSTKGIVRRDTGESYEEFLTTLAKASGIGTPTRADLARIDRKRKKKGSNDDWTHPHDPDAKITKMKDGRTHWRTRPSTPSISTRARSLA
jgi:hypothetical protein